MDSQRWDRDYSGACPVVVYSLGETNSKLSHGCSVVGMAHISGGCLRSSAVPAEKLETVMPGLLEMPSGEEFAMSVVSRLVDVNDRILLHCIVLYTDHKWQEWLVAAQSTGFRVIDLGEVHGMHHRVICVGTGGMLPKFSWIDENTDAYQDPLLIASNGPLSRLESAMLAVTDEPNSLGIIRALIAKAERDPQAACEEAGEHTTVVFMTGVEGTDLMIVRPSGDGHAIAEAIKSVAQSMDIVLYEAGSLTRDDHSEASEGAGFFWLNWKPIPDQWRRVLWKAM